MSDLVVGTIRLIDTTLPSTNLMSHCTTLETPISFNAQGQQGLQGLQGIQGAAGPTGPAGHDGADGADSGPAYSMASTATILLPSNGSATVAQLALDPGAYVFTASVSVSHVSQQPASVFCFLYDTAGAGSPMQNVNATLPPGPNNGNVTGSTTLSLVGSAEFTTPETVFVNCGALPFDHTNNATAANLVAVRVQSIN